MLTSGGDSPGMNAAVRAIVRCGLAAGAAVHAIEGGYSGLLAGRFTAMTGRDVAGFITAGGSLISSSRCPQMHQPEHARRGAAILRDQGVDGLIVIGGDGTHRGALALAEHGAAIVGVPSTIDNDLAHSERTIGFDTATNTLAAVLGQLRDTAASHHRTFVVEAMGRHSGWIALYAGLAAGVDIILIPEVEWTREEVLARLQERVEQGKTFHLIVTAEGAGDAGELAAWLHERTPAGLEVRACIPGHIQRGGTPTVADRLFATELGALAVDALLAGRSDTALGLCGGKIIEQPLAAAAGPKRGIDRALYELALKVG